MAKSKKALQGLMNGLGAFGYFFFCYMNVEYFSPSSLTLTAPKELMLCLGLCFAREIAYLQIAHLQDDDYLPLNLPNFIILTLLIVNTSLHAWGLPLVDEYQFLIVLIVAGAVSYGHWVYFGIKEITEELRISVFNSHRNRHEGKNEKELA